ncbi:MarR family winged helix-turn-helix transcriptional regulator [Desulfosarcina sp.]|uniref:MarR family winged helix-turn-helix transcriptional regulator n=1 Tax=Desulfosarcina sp. TaxID=2027861 RepID=UPI003970D294
METGSHIRLILGRAAKAVERVDRASIAGTGLNISDFSILEALLHKGPLPINTIGRKVLLTSGSMTAAVNRLVQKGLLERIQDSADGRSYYLHLTKSGRMLIKNAYDKHTQNLEKIVEGLTARERSEVVRLLKKIGLHADGVVVD